MTFTREWLLLMHTSDTIKLAAEVMADPYDGGIEMLFQQAERNTSGTLVRVLESSTKRAFSGFIVLESDHDGVAYVTYDTVDYIMATPAQLKACWLKTDLKAKSFEDTAFWNAAIMKEWNPKVVYDPYGNTRVTELVMQEL